MNKIVIYPITPDLWRWEIRCLVCNSLLYCGTSPTKVDAAMEAGQCVYS